jgi:hypothetical protein
MVSSQRDLLSASVVHELKIVHINFRSYWHRANGFMNQIPPLECVILTLKHLQRDPSTVSGLCSISVLIEFATMSIPLIYQRGCSMMGT